jgi:hypothetical protein
MVSDHDNTYNGSTIALAAFGGLRSQWCRPFQWRLQWKGLKTVCYYYYIRDLYLCVHTHLMLTAKCERVYTGHGLCTSESRDGLCPTHVVKTCTFVRFKRMRVCTFTWPFSCVYFDCHDHLFRSAGRRILNGSMEHSAGDCKCSAELKTLIAIDAHLMILSTTIVYPPALWNTELLMNVLQSRLQHFGWVPSVLLESCRWSTRKTYDLMLRLQEEVTTVLDTIIIYPIYNFNRRHFSSKPSGMLQNSFTWQPAICRFW